MWNGIDKRRFPRAAYNCFITIRRKGSPETLTAKTENIGGGGICVLLDMDLGLFAGVDIELNIQDGGEPIRCAGTIVWVVSQRTIGRQGDAVFDTGIEFVDIDDASRERVLRVIDSIIKKG